MRIGWTHEHFMRMSRRIDSLTKAWTSYSAGDGIRASQRMVALCAILTIVPGRLHAQDWPQMGRDAQRTGSTDAIAQRLARIVTSVILDPFAEYETAANGYLPVHYPASLIDNRDVFVIEKGGAYAPWSRWDNITWNIKNVGRDLSNQLVRRWIYHTDWRPVPRSSQAGGPRMEPGYQCLLTQDAVWAPRLGGAIAKISRADGSLVKYINPFGEPVDPSIFAMGSPVVDQAGTIVYNAIKLSPSDAWGRDVEASWLVKVTATGQVSTARYAELLKTLPEPTSPCTATFDPAVLPWPPGRDAVAPVAPCGSLRPPVKGGLSIATDGTILTMTRAHFNERWGYLIAITPDLQLKWAATLRNRLNDGCEVLLPRDEARGGCRSGSRVGVDPADNEPGSGAVSDDSTASPVVAPDGRIFYAAATDYNYAGGHLMAFENDGTFAGAYPAGWDCTPAIYRHDGTYSIILKENHYGGTGSYCNDFEHCPSRLELNDPRAPEAYYITQLAPSLQVEWRFQNTTTESCRRTSSGLQCVRDHPNGFHWCVSAPGIDRLGVVFANNEDGYLYAIQQGGSLRERLFLGSSRGAAYTPISIGGDGLVYVANSGLLLVAGETLGKRRAVSHQN